MNKIYVFGSLIMDHTTKCDANPKDGESVFGKSFNISFGGKGINQAMMAQEITFNVAMIGALGTDDYGQMFKTLIEKRHIDTTGLFIKPASTGISNIIVDKNGQNRIIVVMGANELLTVDDIKQIEYSIEPNSFFLISNEIPVEVIEYVIGLGKKKNCTIVYNPAPYKKINKNVLNKVDFITPNENEVLDLFNLKEYDEDKIIKEFLKTDIKGLIITLGSKGSLYFDRKTIKRIEPVKVKVVDTVGAGDAFNGGFVAGLANGSSIDECLKLATACASLTITKDGALLAQPKMHDIFEFMDLYLNK